MKNSVNSVNHQAQTNSSLLYATPVYPLPPHRGGSIEKLPYNFYLFLKTCY